jgi:tRNA-dihydrouridine synthase A
VFLPECGVAVDHRFCIAPMMECTDRHDRYFLRLISRRAALYTEMVTAKALIFGDRNRLLDFSPEEHPVALQIGGSKPGELARAAHWGEAWGYDEINLNVGCPSDRVQSGRFGACLMAEPVLVADCVAAMRNAVSVPITVKHRIGIDERDSYDGLCEFVGRVAEAGCGTFIVHARKAWLKGLSPRQNRDVPPLRYETVYALKRDFPDLEIVINGGVKTLDAAEQHLEQVDGVMLGREVYHNPWLLADVDARLFGERHASRRTRDAVLEDFLPYVDQQLACGVRLASLTRHIIGLYQGVSGAKRWRRYLSEHAHLEGAGIEVIREALAQVNGPLQRRVA